MGSTRQWKVQPLSLPLTGEIGFYSGSTLYWELALYTPACEMGNPLQANETSTRRVLSRYILHMDTIIMDCLIMSNMCSASKREESTMIGSS